MTAPLRRPPPKIKKQEPTIHVRWMRIPLSTNSIFNKLPPHDILIEDNELVSYEKKVVSIVKVVKTHLLPPKKYNAINIAFSRVPSSDEEIINEIMMSKSGNENLVKVLFQYYPSEEEFINIEEEITPLDMVELKETKEDLEEKLKRLSLKKNKFSRGELFFKRIFKIRKDFFLKLETVNLLFYLDDLNLEKNFLSLVSYYSSVINSVSFTYLILILLKIGNKCNKNEIKAFKISTVESFTRIKNNRNKNLLELGFAKMKNIKAEEENLLTILSKDLSFLEKVENISLGEMEVEIKKIKSITCSDLRVRSKVNKVLRNYEDYLMKQNLFYEYLGELTDEGVRIIYKEMKHFMKENE